MWLPHLDTGGCCGQAYPYCCMRLPLVRLGIFFGCSWRFCASRNKSNQPFSNACATSHRRSVPYEGVHINYVKALQEASDGDFTIDFIHGSRASRRVHPSSPGTAAVQDVADGLADIAIGPLWITGSRLRMTAFTMPIRESARGAFSFPRVHDAPALIVSHSANRFITHRIPIRSPSLDDRPQNKTRRCW